MAREITDQDRARGKRLKEIRDSLGLTQEVMADRLNEAALGLGLTPRHKYYHVSRQEAGSISFEEAAIWLAADPNKDIHGWDWFVLGIEHKRVRPTIRDEAGEDETRVPPTHGRRRPSGAHRKQA